MILKVCSILILCVYLLSGCGGGKVSGIPERKTPPAKLVFEAEKEVEIKYRYRGSNYRDPFLSLVERRVISPTLASKGEGEMPNFGSLSLKGIIKDNNTQIALLSSPTGRYVLKNEKLYDDMNRIVKGVSGTIGDRKIKLVTQDSFTCELKFTEIR